MTVPTKVHLVGYEEIGGYLRAIREDSDLSVAEVAFILRLKPVYLEWIERGEIANLPASAYARAYVAKYASHLACDTAMLLAAYDEASRIHNATPPVKPAPASASAPPVRSSTVVGVAMVLLFGVVVWKFMVPMWRHVQDVPVPASGAVPEIVVAAPATIESHALALPMHALACWRVMPLVMPMGYRYVFWRPLPNWLGMVPTMRYSTELDFPTYATTTFIQ